MTYPIPNINGTTVVNETDVLSPSWHQAITWINTDFSSTNFNEIGITL